MTEKTLGVLVDTELNMSQQPPELHYEECGQQAMGGDSSALLSTVPAFAFCDFGSVVRALAGEDSGKKVIEYLSLLQIPGNMKNEHQLPQKMTVHQKANIVNSMTSLYRRIAGIPLYSFQWITLLGP
ncbi:hypothetical protein llap_8635 [Limosa lapponica baueri]|uniref:Uncharacterized protein n=1 Tax=Limosa lapponica baueri TaxID=1758121 RepID=A0A2I0U4Q0_LIMLA|nr:hypothetical protein llap_8635 [Limosa lapponica baueri]